MLQTCTIYSHPFRPLNSVSVHYPVLLELRALGVQDIAVLAMVELHPCLLALIEMIEAGRERVFEPRYVIGGVQGTPRAYAGPALARLEDEEQRV